MDVSFSYDKKKGVAVIQTEYLENVREHFSVKVPKFGAARFNHFIPDRRYVITPTGQFDLGLFVEIIRFLRKQDIPFNITFSEEFKEVVTIGYSVKNFYQLNLELRDYQKDIVDICLKKGFGTVVLATAGGKTITMATLIENVVNNTVVPIKTLIIVPDIGLVNQTYSDFIEYGIDSKRISKWSGTNVINHEADIIVANMGILQSEKSDLSWISHVGLLIVDEVHKLRRDNKVNKIIRKIRTPHKFGFTGTMPTDPLDQWNIIGKIGPILYERMAYQLREENYVSQALVLILDLVYKALPTYNFADAASTENYIAELEFIMHSEFRNNAIAKLSQNFSNNALIMVDRIEHGEILLQLLKDKLQGKQVFFIRGDVDVEDRKKVQDLMETSTNVVCVAISKIFSTGINIKNLHYIVFAAGGKARVKIIQSIGRGLRLHESKDTLTVIDLGDRLQYGIRHLEERKKLYATEKIKYTTKTLTE